MRLEKAVCSEKLCCFLPIKRQRTRKARPDIGTSSKGCCSTSSDDASSKAGKVDKGCCGTTTDGESIGKEGITSKETKDDPGLSEFQGVASRNSTREAVRLKVTGMDCPDCGAKIDKALLRLPSVQLTAFDYINASCDLSYDPGEFARSSCYNDICSRPDCPQSDIISPEAISQYVARATGFGVEFTLKNNDREEVTKTFLLSYEERPPSDVLARYDAEIISGRKFGWKDLKSVLQLTFPTRGPDAILPRDIMKDLEPYGVDLLPGKSDEEDRVNQDLWRIGIRALACAVLTIPVLVLTWAHLPERPVVYQGVSLGLATCVQILSWPLVSSCIRSVVYLHEADLSVLVSVSTLTAWTFSVVAFVFLAIGRPFAEPFFETVTLLITLIFVGKTIQVATRRSSGGAVRKLQSLQSSEVLLLREVENETVVETMDAR
jgi:Cu2+-exporting ATPase